MFTTCCTALNRYEIRFERRWTSAETLKGGLTWSCSTGGTVRFYGELKERLSVLLLKIHVKNVHTQYHCQIQVLRSHACHPQVILDAGPGYNLKAFRDAYRFNGRPHAKVNSVSIDAKRQGQSDVVPQIITRRVGPRMRWYRLNKKAWLIPFRKSIRMLHSLTQDKRHWYFCCNLSCRFIYLSEAAHYSRVVSASSPGAE